MLLAMFSEGFHFRVIKSWNRVVNSVTLQCKQAHTFIYGFTEAFTRANIQQLSVLPKGLPLQNSNTCTLERIEPLAKR